MPSELPPTPHLGEPFGPVVLETLWRGWGGITDLLQVRLPAQAGPLYCKGAKLYSPEPPAGTEARRFQYT